MFKGNDNGRDSVLSIHPGHPLHPGVFTCIVGNQGEAAFGPRLPTLINGHIVNEIFASFRVVTTLDGIVSINAYSGDHWNTTTDTYRVQCNPPDEASAMSLIFPVVAVTAGQVEPLFFSSMGNPTQGYRGGDWFGIGISHTCTAGAFIFDRIELFTA